MYISNVSVHERILPYENWKYKNYNKYYNIQYIHNQAKNDIKTIILKMLN